MLTQIEGFDAAASRHPRRKTYGVKVGHVCVGGGAPIVVQSMTNTDTADIATTLKQTLELAEAGSEIVRWTVNVPEAAAAVPEIKKRMRDAGCDAPIIGDFHYNGHVLLTKFPECAKALDKYRINPGNVGAGQRRDEQFSTICKIARDNGKPVRIGVNGGSLNQELVMRKMQENTDRNLGKQSEEIINECMVLSSLESTELALESGLRSFEPRVTACPGCDRTTGFTFRELAVRIQGYIRDMMPIWKTQYEVVETMALAVMGCIVNGPGESKAADIGISLPGTGEAPRCPVYIDGKKDVTLEGTYDELAAAFKKLLDTYVSTKYPRKPTAVESVR